MCGVCFQETEEKHSGCCASEVVSVAMNKRRTSHKTVIAICMNE